MGNPPPKISLDSTVVASSQQVSSELKDEVVILNLKAGSYHGLEGTGPRIWSLIQEPRMVSQIRDTILAEYDVPPEQCEADLLELLEELLSNGLIEVIPPQPQ